MKIRRWHHWWCFMGEDREQRAREEITHLEGKGFKAKVWAPLPRHKTSGHIHVSVLCTLNELVNLGGGL